MAQCLERVPPSAIRRRVGGVDAHGDGKARRRLLAPPKPEKGVRPADMRLRVEGIDRDCALVVGERELALAKREQRVGPAIRGVAGPGRIRKRSFEVRDGAPRIARHLWRLCTALTVATGSFFLGQQQMLPKSWHGSP